MHKEVNASKIRMLLVGFLFVLMILSITLCWRSIPEYTVETDYSLPFIWGTQIPSETEIKTETLRRVTIQETWRVDPTNLLYDLLFWNGLIAIVALTPAKLPRIRVTIDFGKADRGMTGESIVRLAGRARLLTSLKN